MISYKLGVFNLFLLINSFFVFSQSKHPHDDGRKIKIPIVFHIISKNDSENIEDSLVLSELQDLNLDFSKSNDMSLLDPDFAKLVANLNIEFQLLDSVFNKNDLKGIQRIYSKKKVNRNLLLINPKTCVNVFVARQKNASGILIDRINLNYKDVGLNTHLLTHETGHWLGLYHIFGQMGSSSWWNITFKDWDDLIEDTPEQKGATAICYQITPDCPCPPKNIFYKGRKRLYNNFMDYNPCRCMFTVGQANKMRNNIINHKIKLFINSKIQRYEKSLIFIVCFLIYIL